jgi:hypothetical protein
LSPIIGSRLGRPGHTGHVRASDPGTKRPTCHSHHLFSFFFYFFLLFFSHYFPDNLPMHLIWLPSELAGGAAARRGFSRRSLSFRRCSPELRRLRRPPRLAINQHPALLTSTYRRQEERVAPNRAARENGAAPGKRGRRQGEGAGAREKGAPCQGKVGRRPPPKKEGAALAAGEGGGGARKKGRREGSA